jgi:hypothetical protein
MPFRCSGEVDLYGSGKKKRLLCRSGKDALWDIAKRCGSTVAAIRAANGIETEPMDDRMLLIPVC